MGFTADNYKDVDAKVTAACAKAGRDRSEVTLIAVSKTKPLEQVVDLIDAGVMDFGENKVQEMRGKMSVLAGECTVTESGHVPVGEAESFDVPAETAANVRWHLIGHLQTNKVKYVTGYSYLVHSVDSVKLAQEIEKNAAKTEAASGTPCVVDILVEVNVGNEETKTGTTFDDVTDLVKAIAEMPHIHIKGLMCIAPFVADPEDNRVLFRQLREKRDEIGAINIPGVEMKELSMGMTNDFEVAIEEGATMVRVGTAIFGARNYAV